MGNSTIEFLENGKMNAFGAGKYRFIDKYLVKDDFKVVVGNHL